MRRLGLVFAACAAMASIGVLSGCGEDAVVKVLPNSPPTVRLTAAPPTYSEADRYFYSVTLNWTAYDPDGRVDHFLIAVIDLPGVRTALPPEVLANYTQAPKWVRTDRSDTTIRFASTYSRADTLYSDDSHIFLIKAVDNNGAESEVQQRAFFSNTIAPSVWIVSPNPSRQTRSFVTPSVLIDWDGEDLDGVFTKKPVKYKYILLSDATELPLQVALSYADTVRRYYAPRAWAGWDSTSADTTVVQFTNLTPSKEYMFVVIAFDEAGAYSPVFDRGINMLLMRVTFAGNRNPTITMFNEFFSYTYPGGSYEPLNPERVIQIEVPANQPVRFNWFATPDEGSIMRSYRWALDIQDLNDNTERTDQETDLAHWSPKNINTTRAVIGPFAGGDTIRTFFIEAEDINGLKSLGMIGFTVVEPEWTKPGGNPRDLVVVKDYRFEVDRKATPTATCVAPPPARAWPTAAELDTFLFARGGYPWKCYPAGVESSPGIFKGFGADTIGTRIARVDQTVRLSTLARYRHVVWISDINGSTSIFPGTAANPMSALKYMTDRNRANTLATYAGMGGKVWVCGGGALEASLVHYNRTNNDGLQPAPSKTYSVENLELVPGRFMYDIFKWQSEAKISSGTIEITRHLGRNAADPLYTTLPARFDYHSEADGDTFPPGRQLIPQNFYYTDSRIEYLSRPNNYYEDLDPGPGENFVSGLDTLYQAAGISLVQTQIPNPTNLNNVCMTVFPARSLGWPTTAHTVFSGFDIWSYRKTQCRDLVRFVLKDLWLLPDNVPPRGQGPMFASRRITAPSAATAPARASIRDQRPVRTGETVRSSRPTRAASGRGR